MQENRVHATALVTLASLVLVLTATNAAQSDGKTVRIDTGIVEGLVEEAGLAFAGGLNDAASSLSVRPAESSGRRASRV